MHATEGSRNAERRLRRVRNADERTPQEFKRSEERLAGGSHVLTGLALRRSERSESQCEMIKNIASERADIIHTK